MVHEFSIGAFGLSITIDGDCPQAVLNLHRHLLPWLTRVPQPSVHSRHLFFSVWAGQTPGRFRVDRDHALLDSDVAETSLVTLLQGTIEEAIVQGSLEFAAIHAGVVAHDGVALLLPGQSRSGKTTLVRELVARGAEYCSDEFAMIDAGGLVHPWPRALMIRDANSEQQPVSAVDLGARVRLAPARAGLILFLQYAAGAEFQVSPVSQSGTLFELLRNTPQLLADSPRILRPLTAVASVATAFEGVRGDAGQAADELLRMMAGLR